MSYLVKVTHTYDFAQSGEGHYTIEPSDKFYVVDDVTGKVVPVIATSSSHSVHISGNLRVPRARGVDRRAVFQSCSSSQQSLLNTAISNTLSLISSANQYTSSLKASSTRYVTWFGTFTSARRTTVLQHFANFSTGSVASYTYDCSCTDSGTSAYIFPDQ